MKMVIGRMKKRLDGMGFPGGGKSAKKPADGASDGPDSLDDLFGGDGGAPEGSDEEEAGESPDEEKSEDAASLSDVSDEELLKEMKKRGLSPAGAQHLGRVSRGPASDDQDM